MLVLALGAVGCQRSDGVVRGTLQGRVTRKSVPVHPGSIVFENKAQGVALAADLDAEGRYVVKTYQAAGLPVGTYQVAILPTNVAPPDELPLAGKKTTPRPKSKTEVPTKYQTVSSSGLTVEVKEGKNEPFDVDLGD